MRTRCPACDTIFRVTSEQLRLKAGRVRCGNCQSVFNAFEHLQDAPANPPGALALTLPEVSNSPEPASNEPQIPAIAQDTATPMPSEAELASAPVPAESAPNHAPASDPPPAIQNTDNPETAGDETPEQSTQAARDAGLVSVRALLDTPAYDRWAAGTLASDGGGHFDVADSARPRWPFVLVALLLAGLLAVQAGLHYRAELTQRFPGLSTLYGTLGIAIPLAHNAELMGIEASDLQADTARGLFVLQATLKNRAPYAQAWPALELTLTDYSDATLVRRVLQPADYLPGTPPPAFAPQSDTSIKLWIEARDLNAAGYRLYLFYP